MRSTRLGTPGTGTPSIVLAKSMHRERIQENAAAFDFSLAERDMAGLDGLDRTGGTAQALEHPWWSPVGGPPRARGCRPPAGPAAVTCGWPFSASRIDWPPADITSNCPLPRMTRPQC